MYGIKCVCGTVHFFHHLLYVIDVSCRRSINHDPFAPQKKRIMKNHGQSCVCAPRKWLWTRNNSTSEHWCRKIIWQWPRFFSNKELFHQGKWKTFSFIHPRSTPNAAPVWSDKGLISYDRPLQPWRYRAPINSSAINSLHRTLLPSVCSCLPSGPLLLPASPGEHPPRGAQRAEMETAGSAHCRAGVRTASPLWSRAAQLRTSSFHCDIIFDIQFETLNSFNAISRHNDSNKAVLLAFDLTTKGKVERGGKTAQLC